MAIDYPERVLSLTTIASDSGNPELPVIANPEAFADVPLQPTTVDREAFIDWQVKTFQVLAGSTYPTDEATLREWAERDFDLASIQPGWYVNRPPSWSIISIPIPNAGTI